MPLISHFLWYSQQDYTWSTKFVLRWCFGSVVFVLLVIEFRSQKGLGYNSAWHHIASLNSSSETSTWGVLGSSGNASRPLLRDWDLGSSEPKRNLVAEWRWLYPSSYFMLWVCLFPGFSIFISPSSDSRAKKTDSPGHSLPPASHGMCFLAFLSHSPLRRRQPRVKTV